MNDFNILKLCGTVFLVQLFYFLLAECNVIGEWEFQNLHNNLSDLHWKQLDKMTEEDRKRICWQVLEDMMPRMRAREDYPGEDGNATMISATVRENCPVAFQHGLVPMSLIRCDDKRLTFYLADGDDDHVFVLRSNRDDSYYSFTGVQRNVTYNLSE